MEVPYESCIYEYGITVKNVLGNKIKTIEDYDLFFKWLDDHPIVSFLYSTFHYEYDKRNNIHYHGLIRSPLPLNYKNDLRLHGYHIYSRKIYNKDGWKNYTIKDNNNEVNNFGDGFVDYKKNT